MNPYEEVRNAFVETFSDMKYVFIGFVSALMMAFIYAFIPVFATPGNTLDFFIASTPWWGFAIILILAILMGILIAMQYYIFKNVKSGKKKEIGTGVGAAFATIISGIFTTATCAACIGVLFSFLGTAGIFFLLGHRWEIVWMGFALAMISIFLTARRINNHCELCGISISR